MNPAKNLSIINLDIFLPRRETVWNKNYRDLYLGYYLHQDLTVYITSSEGPIPNMLHLLVLRDTILVIHTIWLAIVSYSQHLHVRVHFTDITHPCALETSTYYCKPIWKIGHCDLATTLVTSRYQNLWRAKQDYSIATFAE